MYMLVVGRVDRRLLGINFRRNILVLYRKLVCDCVWCAVSSKNIQIGHLVRKTNVVKYDDGD